MKKRRYRAAAFLLSSVIAVSAFTAAMPLTAFADYTVTITRPTSDTAEHTYEAYQVFAGTLHGTGAEAVLSDIVWGSGVNGAAILTALKADETFNVQKEDQTVNAFADADSAAAVAKVIDEWADDSVKLQKFADIVSQNLTATKTAGTKGNDTLKISEAGYYFIKDQDGSQTNATLGAYTDFILKVVDSVEVTAKEDVPSIEKKIVEKDENDADVLTSANTASLGDTVNFELDSTVPDMSAYNKYYYVINDDMCEGLTFDASSVKVYIDNVEIATQYYEVQTGNTADNHTFQIVMKDFKLNYQDKAGKAIKVTYSATLNDNADRTTVGNENKVNLTYSNNPNHTYVGENEPGNGDVTGITPDSKTKTYTTSLLLKKIDGSTSAALEGAKFSLKGSGVNRVIIASKDSFEEDANGTYYKLKDGTYTLTEPTAETEAQYDSTTTKYKVKTSSTLHSGKDENSYVEATTDASGMMAFAGLGAGTYLLTEEIAPNGYNKLTNPITIVIAANPDLNGPNWTVTKDGTALTAPTGIYALEVENNMGATLPGTGGIGTTIFYIVGGALILGALILLITKKRMHTTDDK